MECVEGRAFSLSSATPARAALESADKAKQRKLSGQRQEIAAGCFLQPDNAERRSFRYKLNEEGMTMSAISVKVKVDDVDATHPAVDKLTIDVQERAIESVVNNSHQGVVHEMPQTSWVVSFSGAENSRRRSLLSP